VCVSALFDSRTKINKINQSQEKKERKKQKNIAREGEREAEESEECATTLGNGADGPALTNLYDFNPNCNKLGKRRTTPRLLGCQLRYCLWIIKSRMFLTSDALKKKRGVGTGTRMEGQIILLHFGRSGLFLRRKQRLPGT
jgi:hypothetical protein